MRLGLSLKIQKLNSDKKIWIVGLIISLIILFCGIYIMVNPGTIIVTIGIIMISYAIMDIIEEVIFIKNVKEIEK